MLTAGVAGSLTGSDGLHLTPLGYKVLFVELTKLIVKHWPEMDPEIMTMRIPQCVFTCEGAAEAQRCRGAGPPLPTAVAARCHQNRAR